MFCCFYAGCRGKNKCYKYGSIKRLKKCVTHVCEKTDCGPRFVPHKIGTIVHMLKINNNQI
jgi:hypothetical protein